MATIAKVLRKHSPALLVPVGACAIAFVLASVLDACSSSSNGNNGAADSGSTGVVDGGEGGGGSISTTYPAFTVDTPQVQKNAGTELTAPVLVTVTWPDDMNASTWEAFDDGIGASSYWTATTAEYGVGTPTSGPSNHIRMTQPLPGFLSYTDLQTFVMNAVQDAESDAGTSGGNDAGAEGGTPNPQWPSPTLDPSGNPQTIYSLFIPASTSVTDPGSGASFCVEGGFGYHDNVTVNGKNVPYSVTLECANQTLPDLEETAAHETVESATNPYPTSTTLGWIGFDPSHLAWELYTGYNDELADACQNWEDSYIQLSGNFPYWVQRSWSNKAAPLGHDPCVPAPSTPYHGMTLIPSEETAVAVDLTAIGRPKVSTQGFNVTIGQPLTFHVGFFSDAATDAWTIKADFPADLAVFDTSFNPLGNGKATVTIDKTSGQNGEIATVTVTPTVKGKGGFQVMAITWDPPSTMSYLPHYLPVVLVDH